ncbi:hypothetical protein PRIPAC_96315, partial [Pristionchus pacificus]|uniref:Uncharacterized protein n=1 Tax=Pristionchus pacificus TaxID=54126 RepID=A0A2A6BC62_PRIPA
SFPEDWRRYPIGGGISGEPKANASVGVDLNLNPNWNLTTNVGKGLAGAIDGTVGSLATGTKAIGQSAVNGAADTLNAGVNGISNLGGNVGEAAAGIVGTLGKAITEVGQSFGPLHFGANANLNAQLKAALEKFVGAILSVGVNPLNAPNVIAAFRDLIAAILSASIGASANVNLGPLGSVGAGAGISAIINPILKAIFGVTL